MSRKRTHLAYILLMTTAALAIVFAWDSQRRFMVIKSEVNAIARDSSTLWPEHPAILPLLDEGLRFKPDDVGLRSMRIGLHMQQGNLDAARADLSALRQQPPVRLLLCMIDEVQGLPCDEVRQCYADVATDMQTLARPFRDGARDVAAQSNWHFYALALLMADSPQGPQVAAQLPREFPGWEIMNRFNRKKVLRGMVGHGPAPTPHQQRRGH